MGREEEDRMVVVVVKEKKEHKIIGKQERDNVGGREG